MSGTTMVVLIVFISVGFGVLYDMYKKHLKFKEKALNQSASSAQQNEELEKKITTLEQRVVVLEKIVKDEGYQVQQESTKL